MIRLPHRCLVLLVGPSGAGKSHWAAEQFRPEQVVSSDRLRAIVGEGEHDQRASKDAFDVLELIVEKRLRRGLLTVVDTLGLDAKQRARHRELAAKHRTPCVAVVFDTDADECRRRNRRRARAVPANVVSSQLASWPTVRAQVAAEPFAAVHVGPAPVAIVPAGWEDAPAAAARQEEEPVPLRFGLQLPQFAFEGGPAGMRRQLADVAATAEAVGFQSLWVMDHFVQIPLMGREWEDMLDSYTTLAFLAAHTERVTLGALVTGVTYRNVAHLGKIVATLDVLSGGRAVCGLGAAWFGREHDAYGWDFPPARERLDLLEDALQALPLLWGPGAPPFEGKRLRIAEAICYPRPLQEKVPILVGGSGEKRTLGLVARYADACNLFGDPATVRHKLDVLAAHCAAAGRDPATVEVTHLSSALVIDGGARPAGDLDGAAVARLNAGTVEDQIGRFRELAEAGVQHAIVNLPFLRTAAEVERFAPVIQAFSASDRAVL